MGGLPGDTQQKRRLKGWIGTLCLLAIVVVKLMRYLNLPTLPPGVVGVVPSVLGPAGLLFLIRSGAGRLSRLSLLQTACLVGVISVALELAQLLPRPGILARVNYTFDGLDLGASLVSVAASYFLARALRASRSFARSARHGAL
jgi:hypothetical protein